MCCLLLECSLTAVLLLGLAVVGFLLLLPVLTLIVSVGNCTDACVHSFDFCVNKTAENLQWWMEATKKTIVLDFPEYIKNKTGL